MDFLKFDIDSCKDCYSCLRHCPVKSIRFTNEKAEIIPDLCILCGHCVNVCPQNAKHVVSNIDEVKELIKNNPGKVALSVAPSFISNFNVDSFSSFEKACKKLGFSLVEETARGAYYVTREYHKLLESGKYKTLITTACPSAVTYVCRNFPDAVKYLAPVCSPMIAHGRILKKEYGDDLKIVFVGPCIAKKKEAVESKEIECVLTFEELLEMFNEKNIIFEEASDEKNSINIARYYPINRGIIKSFGGNILDNFDYIAIDGAESINDTLSNIDQMDNIFFEMNMCHNGCINGPCKLETNASMRANTIVRKYIKRASGTPISDLPFEVDFSTEYKPLANVLKTPSEDEIRKILTHIFKYKKEDEINCGACGYSTCREKAIAIYNGLTDPEFCMPYLKNKAESISNEIIKHTPNGIITVNREGILIDVNEKCLDYLGIDKRSVGKFYQDLIDLPELMIALEEGKNVDSIIVYNEKNNMYFDVSITIVKEHHLAFAIYKDVTAVTLNDEKMKNLRKEMIEVTNQVINKQMAAVQEIASLLGESTAEAKVALVNFKNTLKDE